MSTLSKLLAAIALATAAHGCGSGFVDGWRDDQEAASDEDVCSRREGWSWVGGTCQQDGTYAFSDIDANHCNDTNAPGAGLVDGVCYDLAQLNHAQCDAAGAQYGRVWLDRGASSACVTNSEAACVTSGRAYLAPTGTLPEDCIDLPVLSVTSGPLDQTVAEGQAMTKVGLAASDQAVITLVGTNCPEYFTYAGGVSTATNAAVPAGVSVCRATFSAIRNMRGQSPVKSDYVYVTVRIVPGFLAACRDPHRSGPTTKTVTKLLAKVDGDLEHCAEAEKALQALTSLDLDTTGITDLSPLRGLHKLQTLTLTGNAGLVDLSPLAALSALKTLDIDGTGVKSVAPIAGLTALTSLQAADSALGKDPSLKTDATCPKTAASPAVREFCGG